MGGKQRSRDHPIDVPANVTPTSSMLAYQEQEALDRRRWTKEGCLRSCDLIVMVSESPAAAARPALPAQVRSGGAILSLVVAARRRRQGS